MKAYKNQQKCSYERGKCIGLAILLLILMEIIIFSLCFAAESGAFHFGTRDNGYGIHFIDNQKGWIVGDMGLAVTTANEGKSWQRVVISGGESFKDIFFIGNAGWIVGDGGLILHSSNSGKSWEKQISGVSGALMRVFFLDREKGFTVGADGIVLKTSNAGASWETVPLDWLQLLPNELIERGIMSINLYDVFFVDGFFGWIVGDYGTVLHTSDGGKSWNLSQCGYFPSLFSVSFKNKHEGWAVGQNGFFLKTTNGGHKWENVSVKTEESIYKIVMRGKYGVIVGDHATIMTTNDGGKTWQSINLNLLPPLPWLAAVWIMPNTQSAKIFVVGKGINKEVAIK